MSRERQKKQADEMRRRILDTARQIVEEEGPDKLSIRRITGRLEYSAGSIYHYFDSKDAILHELLLEGYRRILGSIQYPMEQLPPLEAIAGSIRSYIQGVLQWPAEYGAVMFSTKPGILAVTSVLDTDVREKRKAMEWLIDNIERGIERGEIAPCEPVVTAQALWCGMFGLAARLIIENAGVSEAYGARLIDRHIALLMKGLVG